MPARKMPARKMPADAGTPKAAADREPAHGGAVNRPIHAARRCLRFYACRAKGSIGRAVTKNPAWSYFRAVPGSGCARQGRAGGRKAAIARFFAPQRICFTFRAGASGLVWHAWPGDFRVTGPDLTQRWVRIGLQAVIGAIGKGFFGQGRRMGSACPVLHLWQRRSMKREHGSRDHEPQCRRRV
jgi:hypothetical protein